MQKEKLQQTPQKYKGSWDYYKQLYANKMDNLEEMDKLLERYSLPRQNQDIIENMNNPITNTKFDLKTPNKQKSRTWWLHRWMLPSI